MQKDSHRPSAPPDPEDDFEWVPEGMKNNDNNIYPVLNGASSNETPADFIIPNDMPIPDAIQQQIIYQKIMEQHQENKKPPKPKQEEKQAPLVIPVPISAPKASFMSPNLEYPESALFKTAGICIWRRKENGKGIQIMMGLEKQNHTLSFFGGKRDKCDIDCVDTAIRQFNEETGKQLENETLTQIRKMLINDEDRVCFWKAEWKSVLFYYEMSYDYGIVKEYKLQKGWNSEIEWLYWIDFEKMYNSVFVTGNPIKVSKNKYPLRSFVVGTMLHNENKKYLMDLHLKNGGDIHNIQAKKGGDIRSTLSLFTHIPKVIRLDILHPITHNIVYHRWIDMEITKIEDHQLLTSLITSICPEFGRNFMLYYTDNKCFKTSKTQHVIDTIPSFNALQKVLASKKTNFITQIALLPTFIIADNLKGIPLSFKAKDVSWKDIENDDEKNNPISAFIHNAASDLSQWWFGGNNEAWKWQFMNDKNNFEDFNASNNKEIERCFTTGNSFASFKRNTVPYQINFVNMCQKNLNTKKIRVIRRVPSSVAGDINDINIPYNAVQYYKWQYCDDNAQWIDYERRISEQLNTLKQTYNKSPSYHQQPFDLRYTLSTQLKANKHGTQYRYLIDVYHCKQRNVSTKKERAVQQIAVYNNKKNYNWFNNGYKWQFKDNGYNEWKDYETSMSDYIEQRYASNQYAAPFQVTRSNTKQRYKIHFNLMQQQSLSTNKYRSIRRIAAANNYNNVNVKQSNIALKHRWEWQDDDASYKQYDKYTSQQIERAANQGIKKYFFVSKKNKNSYEINFSTMRQYNVQSGKQRKVRKVLLEAPWKGNGPNPKQFVGPKGKKDRRTFGEKMRDLYCVVGDNVAREVMKSGKFMRGTLGPFGAGLYFYDSLFVAQEMAKHRSPSNKGNVIKAKVFVGETHDVSSCNDKHYDFITLQKDGKDSVSRSLGFGIEYIVYNMDQVCVVEQTKSKKKF